MNRIRSAFVAFFEISEIALLNPEDLSVYLKERKTVLLYGIFCLFLASMSASVANYFLRDFYGDLFYIEILFFLLSAMFYSTLASIMTGALIDFMMQFHKGRREGRARQTVLIAMVSVLPGVFYFPAAVIANLVEATGFVLLPLSLGLFTWQISILLRATRYLYEVSHKEMVRAIVWSVLGTVLFPVAALFFLFIQVGALIS